MRAVIVAALVPVLGACAASIPAVKPDVARAQILERDREFDAYSAQHGIARAFDAFVADDVVSLPAGEDPVIGRGALFAANSKIPPGVTLRWEPRGADIAESGDLGYTWGVFTVHATGADGKAVERHGKYCTIWKRQHDGAWKAVLDVGNASPSAAASSAPTPSASPSASPAASSPSTS